MALALRRWSVVTSSRSTPNTSVAVARCTSRSWRKAAERTAINAPMQGTAADIIKRAMIKVAQWLDDSALDARVIMQVHDELVLEVREDQIEAASQGLKERMGQAADLDVPLVVEVGVGNNWD